MCTAASVNSALQRVPVPRAGLATGRNLGVTAPPDSTACCKGSNGHSLGSVHRSATTCILSSSGPVLPSPRIPHSTKHAERQRFAVRAAPSSSSGELNHLIIRRATIDDAVTIASIEASCAHIGASGWSLPQVQVLPSANPLFQCSPAHLDVARLPLPAPRGTYPTPALSPVEFTAAHACHMLGPPHRCQQRLAG